MKADDGCRKGEVAAFLEQILFVDGSVDFAGNHAFFTTSSQDGAQKILSVTVFPLNLFSDISLRNLQVVTGVASIVHQRQEAVLNIKQLEVPTLDVWHLHVVCGWTDIFEFLAGENVKGNHVDFGVTVLAGLGGGHLDNLAGTALDHDESVLPECRALHGEGLGRTGIGGGEVILFISHCVVEILGSGRLTEKRVGKSPENFEVW